MKKFVVVVCAAMLVFGVAGMASALNLIQNGTFDDGLTGWVAEGDVVVTNAGPLASYQGMNDNYALLGVELGNDVSRLWQGFVTSSPLLHISFDWAFDFVDLNPLQDDTFISVVGESGAIIHKITLQELTTSLIGVTDGKYDEVIDISSIITGPNAFLGFKLDEIARGLVGSVVGIDNVVVEAVAPVPEPSTVLLLGVGVLGLIGIGRKKFRK